MNSACEVGDVSQACPFKYSDGVVSLNTPHDILNNCYAECDFWFIFCKDYYTTVSLFSIDLLKSIPVSRLPWYPVSVSFSRYEDFSYYLTAVYSIYVLEMLILKEKEHSIIYNLCLFRQTFFFLMIHVEETGKTRNKDFDKEEHIPSLDKIFHEGNIKNIIVKVLECNYWTENDSNIKKNKVVHLLSKALPQRCQIRNLREIIDNYCSQDDSIYDLLLSFIKCSVLGGYSHCTVYPTLEVTKTFYKFFFYDSVDKPHMRAWMLEENQQFLFYTLKEYMIYAVRMIPSLHSVLLEKYNWESFTNTVVGGLDTLHAKINTACDYSYPGCDWFDGIEEELSFINKQQIKHMYQHNRYRLYKVVLTSVTKIEEDECVTDIIDKKNETYDMLKKMSVRHPLTSTVPYTWLRFLGVRETTVSMLLSFQKNILTEGYRSMVKKKLTSLFKRNKKEFELIKMLSDIYEDRENIKLFTLPHHYYKKQKKALQDNFPDPKAQQYAHVCLYCKTFKGFLITKTNHHVHRHAIGNSKIIIDDATLKYFCAKRQEKYENKKRAMVHSQKSIMDNKYEIMKKRKKNAKEQKKKKKNSMCADTEITKINILGKILQFYGKLVILCPKCGSCCQIEKEMYTSQSLMCMACVNDFLK